jgi:hypothetical protein
MIEQTKNQYACFYRFPCLAGWELLIAELMTAGVTLLTGLSTAILLAVG